MQPELLPTTHGRGRLGFIAAIRQDVREVSTDPEIGHPHRLLAKASTFCSHKCASTVPRPGRSTLGQADTMVANSSSGNVQLRGPGNHENNDLPTASPSDGNDIAAYGTPQGVPSYGRLEDRLLLNLLGAA